MKRLLTISLLIVGIGLFFNNNAKAQSGMQIELGPGLQVVSNTNPITGQTNTSTTLGVRGGVKYPFNDKMGMEGSFTLFFPDAGSMWAIDGNFLYNIAAKETFSFYGLAGINLTNQSVGGLSNSEIGANLGAGVEFGQSINFFLQPKYTIGNYDRFEATGGVRFSL